MQELHSTSNDMLPLLFAGLVLVALLFLAVKGIVMMVRGKMAGLALFLVSVGAGLVTLVGLTYSMFMIRVSHEQDRMETAWDEHVQGVSQRDGRLAIPGDISGISSVEPTPGIDLREVVIPAGRPEWVEMPPEEADESFYVSVNSGPYDSALASRRELDEKLVEATNAYIVEVLDRPDAAEYVEFTPGEIHADLVTDEYAEVIQVSFGPMHQSHARLKFDETFVEQIQQRWREAVVASRLAGATLFFVAGLALLGAVYLFLRLDTATRGYYTGRLQFGAGVAILGIIAAGVLAARWIPWL